MNICIAINAYAKMFKKEQINVFFDLLNVEKNPK